MYERVYSKVVLGVAMLVGVEIEQLGGAALKLVFAAIFVMGLALVFIWVRVSQLAEKTTHLTKGVDELNGKIKGLETTMTTHD